MSEALRDADLLGLAGTLVATFIGAWLGYLLAGKQERERGKKLNIALRKALEAEVERCADDAETYLTSNILAPAYRLSTTVYNATFSQLIASGELTADDVRGLLDFYSQVGQVNWCLDQIHEHVTTDANLVKREHSRLIAKLQEMRRPDSRFYPPAIRALTR